MAWIRAGGLIETLQPAFPHCVKGFPASFMSANEVGSLQAGDLMAVFHSDRSGPAVALGPLESAILEMLWERSKLVGVPEVHQALAARGRALSYSAVKAVLNNLAGKGLLRKEKRGKVTHFEAVQTRAEFESAVIDRVIGSLKRNFGQPVIAQFVDQLAVDEAAIEEFERLIAARKKELGE